MRRCWMIVLALLAASLQGQEVRWLVNMTTSPVEAVVEMLASDAALPPDGAWEAPGVRAEASEGILRWELALAPLSSRRLELEPAPQPLVPLRVVRDGETFAVAGWHFGPGGNDLLFLPEAPTAPTRLVRAGQLQATLQTGDDVTWLVRADGSLRLQTAGQPVQLRPDVEIDGQLLRLGQRQLAFEAARLEAGQRRLIGPVEIAPHQQTQMLDPQTLHQASVLVFRADGPRNFRAEWDQHQFRVRDRNENRQPDLAGDEWQITTDAEALYGWRIQEEPGQPAVLLIAADTNEDGRLSAAEWQDPLGRVTDQNGDQRFFAGSMLAETTVQQDAVDLTLEWLGIRVRHQAIDLDADGDPDLMITNDPFVNVSLQADLDDTGHGSTLILLPEPRLEWQPMSYQASLRGGNGTLEVPWRLAEEQLLYPNGGHIRTESGRLQELSTGLGVQLLPSLDLATWQPPVVSWEHQGRVLFAAISVLLPSHWDGSALALHDVRDGRLGLTDQAPWPKLIESPTSARLVMPDGHHEDIPHGTNPKAVYFSPLFGGLHAVGARRGTSGDVHFHDEDGDGIMDHYICRQGDRVRALRYERRSGRLLFRDGDAAVALTQRLEFPSASLYLDDRDQLATLVARSEGETPLVTRYSLNSRGQLPGTRAKPVTWPRQDLLIDGFHANDRLSTATAPYGLQALLPHLDRFSYRVQDLLLPLTPARLQQAEVLVLTHLARGPSEDQLQHLRRWIADGGTLMLAPSMVRPDQRQGLNAILTGLGLQMTLGEPLIDRPGHALASGWLPTPAITRQAFQDPTGELLAEVEALSVQAWPLQQAQQDLLRTDGQTLIGQQLLGKGRIVLLGFPLLSNQGLAHGDNARLLDNLLQWSQP